MKSRSLSILRIVVILFFLAGHGAYAGKVYQWTDEEGGLHLSNVPEEDARTTVVYAKAGGEKIYRWIDDENGVHFSDTPPAGTTDVDVNEIKMTEYDTSVVDPQRYSIVKQAERMAESRRRLEEERLIEKQIRLEERRIAEEMEIMQLNELLREQGYGQRPYGFPYARVY